MFRDRREAGQRLANALQHLRGTPGLLVLGMARGGVPVAAEVAEALLAPLDVLVVRKIGSPRNPELALGALTAASEFLDADMVARTGTTAEELAPVVARERGELARREGLYRAGRPPEPVGGRTVIVVDDGLATGASAIAALRTIQAQHPAHLVLAVPVAPPESLAAVRPYADEVVCLETPSAFRAVGAWYRHFGQTSDDEVRACLADADNRHASHPAGSATS
ncbi:MAG: phosphoribosyltransferase [Gemmatimonadales bacterium]